MLTSRKGNHHEWASSYLYDEYLQEENENYDGDEEMVIEEVGEGIHILSFDFTAVEEVESSQKNEHIEEKTHMLSVIFVPVVQLDSNTIWHLEQLCTLE